jgi:hypothetical protein
VVLEAQDGYADVDYAEVGHDLAEGEDEDCRPEVWPYVFKGKFVWGGEEFGDLGYGVGHGYFINPTLFFGFCVYTH